MFGRVRVLPELEKILHALGAQFLDEQLDLDLLLKMEGKAKISRRLDPGPADMGAVALRAVFEGCTEKPRER
jgi:hypothetical protein